MSAARPFVTLFSLVVSLFIPEYFTAAENGEPSVACPLYLHNNLQLPCWRLGKGNCYCFSQFMRDWNSAQKWCGESYDNEASNLLSFTGMLNYGNSTSNNFILAHINTIPDLKGYSYWTSGRFNRITVRWEWTWSSASDETPNVPIPFNKELMEARKESMGECLIMNNMVMAPNYCSNPYRFICERSLKN